MDSEETSGYHWGGAASTCAHDYLVPVVLSELARLRAELSPGACRLFDVGCGNGSVANMFTREGWEVTGVDPSTDGIAQANAHYPNLELHQGSAYDDLCARYGQFPVVTSLEVVEHVYSPRRFAATLFSLARPGGTLIVTTPYHGYLKNLALALSGRLDSHFTALWDHGHIKFWSRKSLGRLLREAGFVDVRFRRVGRIAALAKSMIAICTRPRG